MKTCFVCEREIPPDRGTCGLADCAHVARANYRAELKRRNEEMQAELAMTRGELEAHLRRVGVPMDRIQDLRGIAETNAMKAARAFVSRRLKLLGLIGPSGTGKTVAACWVIQEACRRWPWNTQATGAMLEPAAFVEASSLSMVSAFDQVDQDRLAYLERVSLLVLDDAGDEATHHGRGLLVKLLMDRHAQGRRTIVTSNLTTAAFQERYGAALLDRIRGDGLLPNLGREKSMRGRARDEVRT